MKTGQYCHCSSLCFPSWFVHYLSLHRIDVSEDLLDQYGAVSRQVAEAMAVGICEKSNVDIGISTTGIAGPLGGTYDKPVGLVFIGVSTRYETLVKKFNFNGNRLENKNSTVNSAFEMILEILK